MMHTKNARTIVALTLLLTLTAAPNAAASDETGGTLPVERYALYVASNRGGDGRETLRYAGTDAKQLARTMSEIGGIGAGNSVVLLEPSKADIDRSFRTFAAGIAGAGGKARRTEFIFYYSGHSDENALLLGKETYSYSQLKAALNAIPSDVHVVMLDSCYSGNFVRAKGGSRKKPFLMDDSTIVQGHAYLSSSSEQETSQESDAIRGSYFTHALVNGLRGAADASGDNKVSLNELYHYAFNETLSRTQTSELGPQHPSYNITLVGSGDLVMTDISEAESLLIIPADCEGSCFIRNADGVLVSEITKIRGTAVSLALPAGVYAVTLVNQGGTTQGDIELGKGQRLVLNEGGFRPVQKSWGRPRGDAGEASGSTSAESAPAGEKVAASGNPAAPDTETELAEAAARARAAALAAANGTGRGNGGPSSPAPAAAAPANRGGSTSTPAVTDMKWSPIGFSILPGKAIPPAARENAKAFFGLFISRNRNIDGIQASGFMSVTEESLSGAQIASFMNVASGQGVLDGIQVASFMNTAAVFGDGVQVAGFMNSAGSFDSGVQIAGFMNSARSLAEGAQIAGFMNFSRGQMKGVQISGFLNAAESISGAQIGFINVAKQCDGVSLGILNFIADGILSPGLFIDTDGNACVQYQGGTPAFFTTFLAGAPLAQIESGNPDYGVFGFGIGTRLGGKHVSVDFELLGKQYIEALVIRDIPDGGFKTEQETREYFEKWELGCVPSARATLNLNVTKHFGFFAGASADCIIDGYNGQAIRCGYRKLSVAIPDSKASLYFAGTLGIRF